MEEGYGPYGSDTCQQGYVWREATPNDHVCVDGSTRQQASDDNQQAGYRRADPLNSISETMTDRCSAEVAIVPSYGARPDTPGTVVLARDSSGNTAWSQPFRVQTGGNGYIRWWCHSTTGNIFDPGTWRPELDNAKTAACITGGVATILGVEAGKAGLSECVGAVKSIGSSAWEGWTPERSRCDDHSTLIRARLGSDRLLQTQCLRE